MVFIDPHVLMVFYQAFSGVSALFSSGVVLTGLLFPGIMLSSCRPFSQIIFSISLCDLFGSIGNSFGFPPNHSPMCPSQAIIFNLFMPASWYYTTCLVYHLRCIVVYKKLFTSMMLVHILCLSTSLVLALLPLSTNSYGLDDELSGTSPCALKGSSTGAIAWLITAFYGSLMVCFLLMTFWSVQMFVHLRTEQLAASSPVYQIFQATRLYPMGMMAVWFPIMIAEYLFVGGVIKVSVFSIALEVLATQYGSITALIFFANSAEARDKWYELMTSSMDRVSRMTFANTDEMSSFWATNHSSFLGRSTINSPVAAQAQSTDPRLSGACNNNMTNVTRHHHNAVQRQTDNPYLMAGEHEAKNIMLRESLINNNTC